MKTKFKETIRLALVALVVMLGIVLTQAQPGGQQGPRPIPNDKQIKEMVSELSTELSLTEKQEQQVSEMFVAHFIEVKEVQDKYKTSHEAERKEMDSVRNEFKKEINSVLSKEQQKQFDEFMKNRKPRKKAKGQKPPKR